MNLRRPDIDILNEHQVSSLLMIPRGTAVDQLPQELAAQVRVALKGYKRASLAASGRFPLNRVHHALNASRPLRAQVALELLSAAAKIAQSNALQFLQHTIKQVEKYGSEMLVVEIPMVTMLTLTKIAEAEKITKERVARILLMKATRNK